jgi:hypothetical protein
MGSIDLSRTSRAGGWRLGRRELCEGMMDGEFGRGGGYGRVPRCRRDWDMEEGSSGCICGEAVWDFTAKRH